MANETTKNQKDSRESSDTESPSNTNRVKRIKNSIIKYSTPTNLMKFIEITPFNVESQPHPRSGHRAVATNSDFWIWGGYHPRSDFTQSPMFAELWRFNYALRQWTLETTKGEGPTSTLASISMCFHHNYAFVFGGTGFPFGRVVSNELHILDLKRLHWKRLELKNRPPEGVYGASMIGKGDYLYILCGTNSWHYHSDVYEIHLPTMTSTQIGFTFHEPEDPSGDGRYRQEAHIFEDQIFLFGGGSNSGLPFSFETLPAFDLNTRIWTLVRTNPDPIHNFPAARKFHSIFPLSKNRLIMFGGAYFDFAAGHHTVPDEYVWIFNFENLEWSRLPPSTLLQPTFFHAAAINQRGEIWSHGGIVQRSAENSSDTRVTTLYKIDTQVPSLKESCWNYFLNCLSDRTCLIQQQHLLSRLNIPAQFIERIH